MKVTTKSQLKVADEAWIATALLHREHPSEADFPVARIVERAAREAIAGSLRPGVYVHVVQHCVANRPANPGRYRMLFETRSGLRRLFRRGDPYHPSREGGKIHPRREEMPSGYEGLIGWYDDWSSQAAASVVNSDPLLSLVGSGDRLWSDEQADAYVRRLREGWE